MSEQKNNLLEVKDLKVSFFTPAGEVKPLAVSPMTLIMAKLWELLENLVLERARRHILLWGFFSPQVKLSEAPLPSREKMSFLFPRKR